jgi:hypothetical protein
VALDAESVIAALDRLFAPGSAELTGMHVRALKSARPNAASDIARFLMETLARRGAVSELSSPAGP